MPDLFSAIQYGTVTSLARPLRREPHVRDVVIVEAVRTPTGRRNGGLSTMHSIDLLGAVQRDLFIRTGVDPLEVGQVVGGCVGQVGMQAMNVTRNAWLAEIGRAS